MQLKWLEDFVELARTRSFTRAAENRFVTHPAFGRRIRSLKEWVGARLIARTKPLELTAAGTVFLDAASNALDILHGARTQLQEASPVLENNLRIATGRTLSATFFPDWYDETVARAGFFTATVSTGSAEEAILQLTAGDADMLIVYSSPHTRLLIDRDRFDWLSVAREVLVPVSAFDARGSVRYRLPAGRPGAGAVARVRAHADPARGAGASSRRNARPPDAAARVPGRLVRSDPRDGAPRARPCVVAAAARRRRRAARRARDRRGRRLADRLRHRAVPATERPAPGTGRDLAHRAGTRRRRRIASAGSARAACAPIGTIACRNGTNACPALPTLRA